MDNYVIILDGESITSTLVNVLIRYLIRGVFNLVLFTLRSFTIYDIEQS